MVPFQFCCLWVGHDSTFEIDVVPFLNISEIWNETTKKWSFYTLISDGLSVLPRVSRSRGLSGKMSSWEWWQEQTCCTYTWRARPSGPLSCSQECSCWKRDTKVSSCYHSRLVQHFIHNWLEMSSWQTFIWVMAGLENDPSVKQKAVIT